MRQIQVESHQHGRRQHVVPRQRMADEAVRDAGHQRRDDERPPHPREQPHVAILVVLVRLGVSARDPRERPPEQPILDRREVSVVLDGHDVLDIEAVAGFRPEADRDEGVDERWHGEGEVVVLYVVRAHPDHEDSGEWVQEDGEGDGAVVHHAGQVADLLHDGEFGFPEIWVGKESGGAL